MQDIRVATGEMVDGLKLGESMKYPSPCPGLSEEGLLATVVEIAASKKMLELTWHGLYFGKIECSCIGPTAYLFTVLD